MSVLGRLNIITDLWDEIKDSEELSKEIPGEKQILINRLERYYKKTGNSRELHKS